MTQVEMENSRTSHRQVDRGRTNTYSYGGYWDHLKALVIRNLLIKKQEKRKSVMEFAMPLYFIAILAILRLSLPDTTFPSVFYPHDADWLNMNRSLDLVYAVPDNDYVNKIMTQVQSQSYIQKVEYLKDEAQLLEQYKYNNSVHAAIVFSDNPLVNKSYTIRLAPKSLLPSTKNKYADVSLCRGGGTFCPSKQYLYSSFLMLQTQVDAAIVKIETQKTYDLSIFLQSLPVFEGTSTNAYVLRSIVPLYMVFAWSQFITYMMILIVQEKEKKIKEGMKMMGLRSSMYWLSWLVIYGSYVLLLAIICIIVLRASQVFRHANLFLLFMLFILYGLSSILLALMITPFFDKAKVAGVVGSFMQILVSFLFFIQVYLGDEVNEGVYWALSLLSPCAFSLGIDKVILFDFSDGLSWHNLWEGPGMPFAGSLIMCFVDIFIYLFLAYYLDNVIPSEFGTKRGPLFIFKKSFWMGSNKLKVRILYIF